MELENPSSSLKPPINWNQYQQILLRLYQSWATFSPDQQSKALEAVLEMQRSREAEPLKFLVPNGAQEKVIREVGNLENFIVISCFANGVGKTAINMAILGAIMWGAPTTAFDYPLYRQYPERWPKLVRIVTEPALVGLMGPIQVESKLWWPQGRYEWSKGGKQHFAFFETDTGFKGEVMTYEQQVKEFEGKTNAINLFIEPPPQPILNASFARQRKGGINLLDMTPLTSAAYVKDELVDKPSITVDGEVLGRVKCINADIEENCEEHGKNGQLKHRDIQQMISRYDPDELEARAHGNFMHLSGRILKDFDREVHVREFDIPESGVSHGMALDPAIAKPLMILWRFVDKAGVLHYYDESPEFEFHNAKDSNLTVADYVQIIKAKEEGRVMDSRILDRHFGNARRTLGGNTLKEEFAEAGLDFSDSYTMDPAAEVEAGILKMKGYFKYDKSKPIDALNCPKIVIHPRCKNLITSAERWSRDPKTGKPLDAFKDPIDCLRYDVMSEPRVETPTAWPTVAKPYYGVEA
jgi:hypothetical protein